LNTIVVTGGDAEFMADLFGGVAVIEPDLVFMGMDLVFADTAPRSGLRG
jgi:pantothenate kinase type III